MARSRFSVSFRAVDLGPTVLGPDHVIGTALDTPKTPKTPDTSQFPAMRALKNNVRLALALAVSLACAGASSALPLSPTLDPPATLSFLHLTDLHIDPDYKINSTTYSQCHRVPPTFKKGLAKEFGMLGTDCDAPPELIKSAMDLIKNKWGRNAPSQEQTRVVIWTGDSARHDRDPTVPMSNKLVLDHNQVWTRRLWGYFTCS